MKFRTELEVEKAPFQIHYGSKILCIGSCFAQQMEERLRERKFSTFANPFGILFHPFSIAECLETILTQKKFTAQDLIYHDGLFHSLLHHGNFSKPDETETLKGINALISEAHDFLSAADVLLITFGTAMVFEHKETKQAVANCHRIPQEQFTKRLLSVEEVVKRCSVVMQQIFEHHKTLIAIISVSPVRYLRFGIHENQLAKATLLLAVELLSQKFPALHYFPAYEIVMDDLRDYRFMNEDLIHPNKQATDYIWQKFSSSFFDENTLQLMQEVEAVNSAFNHRPRMENSEAHKTFLRNFHSKTLELRNKIPDADWIKELTYFGRSAK